MRLNEFLGIKYPIIQGGMANIATGEFAAAVSNAGGLGLIASGGWDAERIREEIKKCRANTDKPFGVNLMLMNPDVDNIAKMLTEEKVAVIDTMNGFTDIKSFIRKFTDKPIVVINTHGHPDHRAGVRAAV